MFRLLNMLKLVLFELLLLAMPFVLDFHDSDEGWYSSTSYLFSSFRANFYFSSGKDFLTM